ncbi:prepilin peptidase (plasmid) [Marinovum sp. KMM 9989]
MLFAPAIGSFLGVVIDRLPAGLPLIAGRSRCAGCARVLAPLDLIPILSFLALRGRCRNCRAPIPTRLPLIEGAALAVALWGWLTVPNGVLLWTCLLGWSLLALAVIDARHMILPDALTLPLIALGLGASLWLPGLPPGVHLAGAALGAASFWALRAVYFRLRHTEGLGLGDVKLFAAAGAWVGPGALASVLLIAGVSGLIFAALRARHRGPAGPVAFGPFLCAGTWLTWLYGPLVWSG